MASRVAPAFFLSLMLAGCHGGEAPPTVVIAAPVVPTASVAAVASAEANAAPADGIFVHTAAELVAAFETVATKGGGTIALAGGDYHLGRASFGPSAHIARLSSSPDTNPALVVKGLKKAKLVRQDPGSAPRILTHDRKARVLTFEGAEDLVIDGVVSGHDDSTDEVCSAVVFGFEGGRRITLRNTELFGSGTHGVYLHLVEDFLMERSKIRSCTQGLVDIDRSKRVLFSNDEMYDTKVSGPLFSVLYSQAVTVEGCSFHDNAGKAIFQAFISTGASGGEAITVRKSTFANNQTFAFELGPGQTRASDNVIR